MNGYTVYDVRLTVGAKARGEDWNPTDASRQMLAVRKIFVACLLALDRDPSITWDTILNFCGGFFVLNIWGMVPAKEVK